MSAFDLSASFERARRLFGDTGLEPTRRQRSDRGVPRLGAEVMEEIRRLVSGQDRPRMVDILAEVGRFCRSRGLRPPSRAALYRLLERIPGHEYRIAELPDDVRATLHNVDPAAAVPGSQLAFHCFNYGNSRALSFAAALPWIDLYQALRKRGWRARSRGLIEAICKRRGI